MIENIPKNLNERKDATENVIQKLFVSNLFVKIRAKMPRFISHIFVTVHRIDGERETNRCLAYLTQSRNGSKEY